MDTQRHVRNDTKCVLALVDFVVPEHFLTVQIAHYTLYIKAISLHVHVVEFYTMLSAFPSEDYQISAALSSPDSPEAA